MISMRVAFFLLLALSCYAQTSPNGNSLACSDSQGLVIPCPAYASGSAAAAIWTPVPNTYPESKSGSQQVFQKLVHGKQVNGSTVAILPIEDKESGQIAFAVATTNSYATHAILEIFYKDKVILDKREVILTRSKRVTVPLFGQVMSMSDDLDLKLSDVEYMRVGLVKDLETYEFWSMEDKPEKK